MPAITLLDGGLGQEINNRSILPSTPLWCVDVMMSQPNIVADVHREFLHAGAQVITLNTYTSTRPRMILNGYNEALFEQSQYKAIDIATKVKQEFCDKNIQIIGCLPPLVASYVSEASKDYEESLALYQEIVALQTPNIDAFLIETMVIMAEAEAAIHATQEIGQASQKPTYIAFSVDDHDAGKLRSGESLLDAITMACENHVDGILINCSVPEATTQAMRILADIARDNIRFGGYANGFTSIDALQPGHTVDCLTSRQDLSPQTYMGFVQQWLDMGANIIGGCCEVSVAHIQYINDILNDKGYQRIGL